MDTKLETARAEIDALKSEDKRLRLAWSRENADICQILGKALDALIGAVISGKFEAQDE